MLRGVQALPAGSSLRYRDGAVTIARYWDPAAIAVRPWTDDEAADGDARGAARAPSRSQMMSDVPLGVFLSGGIDSSSIVAFMSRGVGRSRSTASAWASRTARYNELPYAREVAALLRHEHTERLVTPDLAELFDRLIPHLDEPFADVSLFPTYLVSQVAREHVTVALSGDGGDELFGGYDAYEAQALAVALRRGSARRWCRRWRRSARRCRRADRRRDWSTSSSASSAASPPAPADLEHYRWMVHLGSRGASAGSTRRRFAAAARRQRRLRAGARGRWRAAAATTCSTASCTPT